MAILLHVHWKGIFSDSIYENSFDFLENREIAQKRQENLENLVTWEEKLDEELGERKENSIFGVHRWDH